MWDWNLFLHVKKTAKVGNLQGDGAEENIKSRRKPIRQEERKLLI